MMSAQDTRQANGFVENVQRLMEFAGLNQEELAQKAGIGQSTVSGFCSGNMASERSPTLRTVEKIAQVFNLPAWLLLIPGIPVELMLDARTRGAIEGYCDGLRHQASRFAEQINGSLTHSGQDTMTRM
jgi:transcriptional regulator with XRE-family HTH domain